MKVGPKSSLRPFLHRALQLINACFGKSSLGKSSLGKVWVEIQFRLQEQCVGYMIRFIWLL